MSTSETAANPSLPLYQPVLTRLLEQHARAGFPPDLALDLVLNELVVRVADATDASGAALALARGNKMVCRAATGLHAPDLGIPLDMRNGLSGECVRTRAPQMSGDAENDPRMDAAMARRMGIRSMLLVPVFEEERPADGEGTLAGVLEVFSPQANAFSHAEQVMLEEFAGECARIRQAAARMEIGVAPSFVLDAPSLVIDEEETAEESAATASGTIAWPKEEESGLEPERGAEAQEEWLAPEREVPSGDEVGKGEREASEYGAVLPFVARPVGDPGDDRRRDPYGTAGWILGGLVVVAAVAVCLLIAWRIGWMPWSDAKDEGQAAVSQQAVVNPQPAVNAGAASAVEAGGGESQGSRGSRERAASARKQGGIRNSAKSAADGAPDELVVYEKGKVIFRMKPAPPRGAARGGESSGADGGDAKTPGGRAAGEGESTDAATQAAVGGGVTSGSSTQPPPRTSPSTSQRTSSRTMPRSSLRTRLWLAPPEAESRLVTRVEPQYPVGALAARRAGDVTLEVHVAENGTVSSVRRLSGDPVLADAAAQAVRNWRYQPYRSHQQASAFQTDVTVRFSLPN